MPYQKYDKKPKTIYWDRLLNKKVLLKGEHTITFRSSLEFSVYTLLKTLIGCEVYCQIPIKGDSLLWIVDFMIREKDDYGKKVLGEFRSQLGLPSRGSIYVEAKGVITREFAEKLELCSIECASVYRNLIAFGDTPLGVVIENDFSVKCFPIMSLSLLQKLVIHCNNMYK